MPVRICTSVTNYVDTYFRKDKKAPLELNIIDVAVLLDSYETKRIIKEYVPYSLDRLKIIYNEQKQTIDNLSYKNNQLNYIRQYAILVSLAKLIDFKILLQYSSTK